MMKLLIDFGVKLSTRDQDGKTPLHIAAEYGHILTYMSLYLTLLNLYKSAKCVSWSESAKCVWSESAKCVSWSDC
jgi:ankyrin repeat protein